MTFPFDIQAIKDIVTPWSIQRYERGDFGRRDMRRFLENMHHHTRALISAYGQTDPKFYEGIHRQATDALTHIQVTTGLIPNIRMMDTPNDPALTEETRAAAMRMIRDFGIEQPEFYTALLELAVHAATLTTKRAKVIADGYDRTNL